MADCQVDCSVRFAICPGLVLLDAWLYWRGVVTPQACLHLSVSVPWAVESGGLYVFCADCNVHAGADCSAWKLLQGLPEDLTRAKSVS